jgi:hypothetical protein
MEDAEMLKADGKLGEMVINMTVPDCIEKLGVVIDRYMDMETEAKMTWRYWVMASACHDIFPTFPYLFLNAMRGSGKSRLLKLTAFLLDGTYTTAPTESVLFRTHDPLCIDEAESISSKERSAIREVLNAAYKKGLTIKRMKKAGETGDWKVEEFDVYRPIMMANIDGMDDVLEDRCLKIVLEKSSNPEITRRLEMFELDPDCCAVRLFLRYMSMGSVGSAVSDGIKKVLGSLFTHLNRIPTPTDIITLPTYTNTTNTTNELDEVRLEVLIESIEKSVLQGRDLELWLPLFIMASLHSPELFLIIAVAEGVASSRQKSMTMENRDITFLSHLSNMIQDDYREGGWITATDIVQRYIFANPDDVKWFTAEWVGRAMVRNMAASDRRRLAKGREYILNTERIIAKAVRFGLIKDIRKEEQKGLEG